ncbi:MAG: mechanosensitive ion channel family protein [Rhodospirillaceae bacterium]|nr:mechanosensitive ion channel family protein [Rhodospirillaceae bacterium]
MTASETLSRAVTETGQAILDFRLADLWGPDMRRTLESFAILGAFILFRRLISNQVLKRIANRAPSARGRRAQALDALRGPLRGIPFIIGLLIAGKHMHFTKDFASIHMTIVRSLLAFNIFWILYVLVEPMSFVFNHLQRIFSVSLMTWTIKAVKLLVVMIGAATILDLWGVRVGPILAGFGLFGVAVALGAQDLFKNLISGLLIIAEKRFNPGDWVRVDGVVEGVVETIGFRSTLIRRFDKAPVYVPNTALSDHAVTNFSQMTYRRINWTIGVEYRTSIRQLRTIRDDIDAYLRGNSDIAQPPDAPLFVRIDKFSDSSIDILVYCFTRTTEWGEWLRVKEALAYRVKDIVVQAGTAFAFPSQSVYVETLPENTPERFTPPSDTTVS